MFKKNLIKKFIAEASSSSRDNNEEMIYRSTEELPVIILSDDDEEKDDNIPVITIDDDDEDQPEEEESIDEPAFKIVADTVKTNKKFKTARREVTFKIKNLPKNGTDPLEWIRTAVTGVVNNITSTVEPSDKIGLEFKSDQFTNSAWLKFRTAKDLTFDDVWNLLSSIFQSNAEGLNTESFKLIMTQIKMPTGQGRSRAHGYNSYIEEWRSRKGVIYIENKDNLCLVRALVIGRVYAKNGASRQHKNEIRRNTNKQQDKKVQSLLTKSGVVIPAEGCGIEELCKFQLYLTRYQIRVYSAGTKGRELIYEGPKAEMRINLLHHNNHYSLITSLTAAFVCGYYCEDCNVPHDNRYDHRCPASCPACLMKPRCQMVSKKLCADCNRDFQSEVCFDNHKTGGVCQKLRRCHKCHRTINRKRAHNCNEVFCSTCRMFQPDNHMCYIQPSIKPKPYSTLFIFFDLETRQETNYRDGDDSVKIHEPNLCVLQQRCTTCMDTDDIYACGKCGIRQVVIKPGAKEVIEQLMNHILVQRNKFKKTVVIAHNGQAFDHQFILKYLLEKTSNTPELIMRGSKILLMEIDRVRFIDSLNYFPMSLSALPAAFDLPSDYKKGYFPHLFNTKENEQYVGCIPDISYYSPNDLKICDDCDIRCNKHGCRNNLLNWYEQHKNQKFQFNEEFVAYCISDVKILTQACLKFRTNMLEECNVCPFTEACTIASTCNLVYRRNFLKPSTIGIIPRRGYRKADMQSKSAVKWMIEEEFKRGLTIEHAFNGREMVIAGMKVDGYIRSTKQIFEFHGCYYHGHECQTVNRNKPLYENSEDTLAARRQRTADKTAKLREMGYEVIEMWECQYNTSVSEDHPMLTNLPLNPRDAFYGGRTGNTRTYYKIKPGEKIKYIDVCSLYPWVCKYRKFPVGHPEIIIGDKCNDIDLATTDGLIKCRILPPEELYHPVLPVKMNNKLMFVLCRTCGEKFSDKCDHDRDERALSGTWVIDEVLKALEKGYTMLELFEIWRYKTVEHEPGNDGLFSKFIDKFLKIKQQASGWPSECLNQQQKNLYIQNYKQHEGVDLEPGEIKKNAGLRSMAKLMLNSFWGKFGQRENQSKTSIVRSAKDLYDILVDCSIDVNSVQMVNENVLIVNWMHNEEASEALPTVNVCIAAYTTAHARLKLYSYLEQLGERVLYYDTDSVIYVSSEGAYDPPTGSFLGDMTDELEAEFGPGSYIEELVSGGPKNYSFQVFSTAKNKMLGKCKVKGFSLNYEVSRLINLSSMRESVIGQNNPIPITSRNIRRTRQHDIISTTELKNYRITSMKRKFLDDYSSLPYGHKKLNIAD